MYGCTTFCCTYLSVDGHLGCFHCLGIMNNATLNNCVQDFVWAYIFICLVYIFRSKISEPHGNSVFNFLRDCQIVFQSGCAILYSHQKCRRVPVPPHSHQCLLFSRFCYNYSRGCEAVCKWWFWFAFLRRLTMFNVFSRAYAIHWGTCLLTKYGLWAF